MISEMQDYYHHRAGIYDESMGYNNPDVVQALRPLIDHLVQRFEGKFLLEIACGPGFWTQHLAASATSILATDYNESTLAEARKKNLGANVDLRVADAYRLPDFSGTFNASFAGDWFCHVPIRQRENFLRGLHAALSPGSTIIFCDQSSRKELLTEDFDSEGNHLQTRTLPDGRTFSVIKNFPGKTEIEDLLAPFSDDVRITDFPEVRRYLIEYIL